MRSEPTMFAGRDQVNPQAGRDCAADVYRQAGITEPARGDRRGRGLRAVQLVRADVAREPRLRARGRGWKLTDAGRHRMIDGGDIPWNCSGGVLSSNPIGASGMLRFLETAMQVRGQAGEHQVDDVRARRSARPTAAGRSSSPCGCSAPTSPERSRAPAGMLGGSRRRGRTGHERRSSVKVVVDYDVCASNAVCMGIVPEVFEVRDDGLPLRAGREPARGVPRAGAQAANNCPTGAISIVEDE